MDRRAPLVTGTPVVVGAVILGVAVRVLLMSLGRTPGLAAKLSQDYTSMMAGSLAPTVQDADAARSRVRSRRENARLHAAHREPRAGVHAARRASAHVRGPLGRGLVLPLAVGGLGAGRGVSRAGSRISDRRTTCGRTRGATLHIFRKTTQTIACWQEGPLVYAFISTLPSEAVIALARRHAAAAARRPTDTGTAPWHRRPFRWGLLEHGPHQPLDHSTHPARRPGMSSSPSPAATGSAARRTRASGASRASTPATRR